MRSKFYTFFCALFLLHCTKLFAQANDTFYNSFVQIYKEKGRSDDSTLRLLCTTTLACFDIDNGLYRDELRMLMQNGNSGKQAIEMLTASTLNRFFENEFKAYYCPELVKYRKVEDFIVEATCRCFPDSDENGGYDALVKAGYMFESCKSILQRDSAFIQQLRLFLAVMDEKVTIAFAGCFPNYMFSNCLHLRKMVVSYLVELQNDNLQEIHKLEQK